MSENDQTTYAPLTIEDWEIALTPYQANAGAALSLGFNLCILKNHLSVEPHESQKVIEEIDRALEMLYPYTDFHLVSFDYFLKFVQGRLTLEEEQMLKSMGIKF